MDVRSTSQKEILKNVDSFNDLESSLKEIDVALVNGLDGCCKKSSSVEDSQSSKCGSYVKVDDSNPKNKRGELDLPQCSFSKKSLSKSSSFPNAASSNPPSEKPPKDATGGMSSKESKYESFTRSISLPAPLMKPISAMKGSREQHLGVSPKLTVKWAPDVYDPPPTSLSHSVKNKKQQKSKNRKNGKKGQKGSKSSRGNGGTGSKDNKRQARKSVGSSDQKSFDSHGSLVNALNELESLGDGSSDSNCGSVFLKTALTKVHYSVTEAL